jgi:TgpA N-terminal domain/Transglutaminase-like superfamily
MTATLTPRGVVRASSGPRGASPGTAVAAGAAVLLGSLALDPVFAARSWLPPVVAAVTVVTLGGIALRAAASRLAGSGFPGALLRPVVPVGQVLLVLGLLTAVYAPGHAVAGVVPTWSSLGDLSAVLRSGATAVNEQATPALPLTGLVALTTVFVALIALAVDMLVTARQPALGGLGLLVLYCVPVSTITGHVALVAFLAPACGFAVLLWADQRARLPESQAGAGSPLGTGSLAALRIGAVALVAGVLLPLGVPMLAEGSLAKGLGDGGGGPASTGTKLDPVAELQGQLTKPDPVTLLKLRTTVDDPGYLRAVALDDYTRTGWRLGSLESGQSLASPAVLQPPPDQGDYRTVDESIKVVQHDDQFMPVPYGPLRVKVAGGGQAWQFDPENATIFGRGVTTAGASYTVQAAEPRPTPEMLAAATQPSGSEQFVRRYTALPPLNSSVTDLVGRLTNAGQTPYQRVMSIYDYFTDKDNGFTYDLTTTPGTSGDQLADFLQNKQGYCEQYAGAMGVLVRAAHVPARVVLGYTTGQKHGNERVITTDDAHAWVEVWFAGLGWVPFDPTPIGDGRAATMAWAPRADATQQAAPTAPTAAPVPTPQPTTAPSQLPKEQDYVPVDLAGSRSDGAPTTRYVVAGTALVLVALALTPALGRRRQRARRLSDGRPAALWDELLAVLADLGLPAGHTGTARQMARRLTEHIGGGDPDALAAVGTLTLAEEQSVYAPVAAADPAELRTALRLVSRALGRSVGRRQRVLAVLLPASTIAAAAEWVSAHLPRRSAHPA